MDYRFKGDNEEDVEGHSLGNLILTALIEKNNSLEDSIALLSSHLKVKGKVIPVSDEVVTLYATMDDGCIVKGEKNIPSIELVVEDGIYSRILFIQTCIISQQLYEAITIDVGLTFALRFCIIYVIWSWSSSLSQ